jgi:threonine dehydrogenase-like Zn-dependent dehydrogenase
MRALVYDGELRLERDYPKPEPAPGQAIVRVTKAGICNTDLELVKGYMGFGGVLGHEFVGVVESGGPEWEGRRVVGEINLACGECTCCRAGMPSQCPNRTTLGINRHDGAFADYLQLPTANLHALPDTVSDDQAAFVEPLAAALQISERRQIMPSERVVVIGDGKLGLLVAQVLRLTGCHLRLVGHHDSKLVLAQGWGIETARAGDLGANLADVVVDCTGQASGFAASLDIVRPRGTIVLKSTYHGLPEADLTRVVVDEVSVVGSRCGPFEPAIRLLAAGLVDVEAMIQARYSLDDGVVALERAAQRGTLKVLLEVG